MIGGGKCHGLFGVSCNGTRTTLGKNRKYLVLCDDCEAKKTAPCDTVGIPFVPVHEDLISPLATASKKKRVRSAKESDNAVISAEKQQRLAEVAVNRSQRDTDSTQNRAKLERLAARNGKKAPALRRQRSVRKNKTQLVKEILEAEIAAAADDSEAEADQD
jgi:hypothetical protein